MKRDWFVKIRGGEMPQVKKLSNVSWRVEGDLIIFYKESIAILVVPKYSLMYMEAADD